LLLPLLVLGAGIVRGECAIRSGEIWRFDIGGYDPRDLLRGRYLRFRIEPQWGDPHDQDLASRDAECACLERIAERSSAILHAASCASARASCDSFVVFAELAALDRFYVPEARAKELEQRLQSAAARDAAQALVSIDRNGSPTLVDLEIDGVPTAP